ncbi:mannose-6-phosphate isomerase [Nostoc sp. UCD121]|nr:MULTISPECIES: mannose-6-phosphate isomerase [unclassified Nostoc]MBC1224002.1 mannose-6-phosphate isomerase [Nostoc sp. UCD120]MBC1277882.1 mannose-6-phosphate isomerase [Nostoc sp. UCD121]MBC1294739.1 mannose-6-phosphate isomerase [Nostoc sp. UCD122]
MRILPTGQPEGGTSLIACYVPDLEHDIVMPLRSLGHSDDEIRALGEVGI